jgi:hypothetical protein
MSTISQKTYIGSDQDEHIIRIQVQNIQDK